MPKPPPTSGVSTRSCGTGILSTPSARRRRTTATPWVLAMRVYRPSAGSQRPMAARGSIAAGARRVSSSRTRATCAAPAKAASTAAASPSAQSKATLPGASGQIARAPGASAASTSAAAGSASRSTTTAPAASAACSGVSAIAIATASPT